MFVSSLCFLAVARLWHFRKVHQYLVVAGRETAAGLEYSVAAVVVLEIVE